MSPYETAMKIIEDYQMGVWGSPYSIGKETAIAISAIQSAIVEATNAEIEKRRAAEAKVERLQQALMPWTVCVDRSDGK